MSGRKAGVITIIGMKEVYHALKPPFSQLKGLNVRKSNTIAVVRRLYIHLTNAYPEAVVINLDHIPGSTAEHTAAGHIYSYCQYLDNRNDE